MKYQWDQPNSVISELQVLKSTRSGAQEATVFLRPEIDAVAIKRLHTSLINRGICVNTDFENDAPVLRLTHFQNTQNILQGLTESGAVSGQPQQQSDAKESKAPSFKERIDANKLILAAFFYQIGNIGAALSGWFRRDTDEIRTGLAFMVGDSFMMLFGKRTQEEKYNSLMQDFSDFLSINGHSASPLSSFSPLAAPESVSAWQRVRNYMHDKVIIVKSVSEMSAGAFFARAGIRQSNVFKASAGAAVGLGFAMGMAIPEKSASDLRREFEVSSDAEVKQKISALPLLQRIKYTILTNPLLVSGKMALFNNGLTFIGAIDERNYAKKHGISRKMQELDAKISGGTYKNSIFESPKTIETGAMQQWITADKHTKEITSQLDTLHSFYSQSSSNTPTKKGDFKESLKSILPWPKAPATQANTHPFAENGAGWKTLEAIEQREGVSVAENMTTADRINRAHGLLLDDEQETKESLKEAGKTLIDLESSKKKLVEGRTLKILGRDVVTVKDGKFWIFNLIQSLAFGAANTLYGTASKNGSQSNANAMAERFITAIANDAMAQTPDRQAELINIATHYAGRNSALNITPNEMRDKLQERIEQLKLHPLFQNQTREEKQVAEAEIALNEPSKSSDITAETALPGDSGYSQKIQKSAPLQGMEASTLFQHAEKKSTPLGSNTLH